MRMNKLLLVMVLFAGLLAGCAASGGNQGAQSSTSGSGGSGSDGNVVTDTAADTAKDVAGSAGSEAKAATQENLNREVREGVNTLFDNIFKRK